ncbi:hypothetical protein QQ045_002677 [Rhodiola kirilowii]
MNVKMVALYDQLGEKRDLYGLISLLILVIGGDLANPNPAVLTYERRLFCPFEYALQPPPSWYKEECVAVNKPELPSDASQLKHYSGPQCFIIPGNHDWFDRWATHLCITYVIRSVGWVGCIETSQKGELVQEKDGTE